MWGEIIIDSDIFLFSDRISTSVKLASETSGDLQAKHSYPKRADMNQPEGFHPLEIPPTKKKYLRQRKSQIRSPSMPQLRDWWASSKLWTGCFKPINGTIYSNSTTPTTFWPPFFTLPLAALPLSLPLQFKVDTVNLFKCSSISAFSLLNLRMRT